MLRNVLLSDERDRRPRVDGPDLARAQHGREIVRRGLRERAQRAALRIRAIARAEPAAAPRESVLGDRAVGREARAQLAKERFMGAGLGSEGGERARLLCADEAVLDELGDRDGHGPEGRMQRDEARLDRLGALQRSQVLGEEVRIDRVRSSVVHEVDVDRRAGLSVREAATSPVEEVRPSRQARRVALLREVLGVTGRAEARQELRVTAELRADEVARPLLPAPMPVERQQRALRPRRQRGFSDPRIERAAVLCERDLDLPPDGVAHRGLVSA